MTETCKFEPIDKQVPNILGTTSSSKVGLVQRIRMLQDTKASQKKYEGLRQEFKDVINHKMGLVPGHEAVLKVKPGKSGTIWPLRPMPEPVREEAIGVLKDMVSYDILEGVTEPTEFEISFI